MVPEFAKGQTFNSRRSSRSDEYREAKALGYQTRPVLLGPIPLPEARQEQDATLDPLSLLGELIPVYIDVLRRLAANGAEWVQLDEALPRARSR
jgi:5-methyltetrahydropteroyltriglutamate--homocysteine methyltransferase